MSLPNGAMGWSAVCDCDIFLTITTYFLHDVTLHLSLSTRQNANHNKSGQFLSSEGSSANSVDRDQMAPLSELVHRSSLIWVHNVYLYTYIYISQ